MMGHSASVLFALATMAAAADKEVSSFSHSELPAGQKFEIETADRIYRGQLLDADTGECLLTSSPDGDRFSVPRTVFVLGATAGRQARQMFVMMHEVKVGLKLELGVDDLDEKNRLITSEVKNIRLTD